MLKNVLRKTLPFIIFLLCSQLVIQAQQGLLSHDQTGINDMIHKANKVYAQRFSSQGSSLFDSLYTRDACLFVPGQLSVCDQSDIRKYFASFSDKKELQVLRTAQKISIHADIIVEEGNYTFYSPVMDSPETGKYLTLWKEDFGKWKIYREMWNGNGRIQ